MSLKIEKKNEGTKDTVFLTGRLDTATAPELDTFAEKELLNTQELVLDFTGLEYISSAGLRVILKMQKFMNVKGTMKLIHVSDIIQDLFDITGFGHSLLYPKASFIVPEFTYTQDIKYTLAGCADIIFHIMENTYFTRGTKMQMNIEVMECLMRNVIRYSLVLKKSPMDYEARANLCWIASIVSLHIMCRNHLGTITAIPKECGIS